MLSTPRSWTPTFVCAILAVALAVPGLALSAAAGVAPALMAALLVGSLGFTAATFAMLAMRVRTLELQNEGLVEEISQELDRVHDKFAIFADALEAPRSLTPADEREATESASVRRLSVK